MRTSRAPGDWSGAWHVRGVCHDAAISKKPARRATPSRHPHRYRSGRATLAVRPKLHATLGLDPGSMKILNILLLFVPAAIAAKFMHASPVLVFALSAIAIIPLSGYLGRATEELASYTGPTLGGLLNATLGNLAELIIAILALRAGLIDLVKASITGSILGNLLLVLGAAQLMGGLKRKTQRFSVALAGLSISLLVIAVIGLVIPAVY